jgi:hypothetical protein
VNAYWFKGGRQTHVVLASTKAIAVWYAHSSRTWMQDPKYLRKDNRSLTQQESGFVMAHNANTALVNVISELRSNGASEETIQRYEKLKQGIKE